jgi:hypothetical protein
MIQTENNEMTQVISNTVPGELAAYHTQMVEKYKNVKPDTIKTSPDAMALIAYNGYYTLSNAAGAFFAVDTNIHIQNGSATPIYDISLLISLDGKKSFRFLFTGTFKNGHLVMSSAAIEGLNADLQFVHTDGSDGTTATCTGTISLPNTPEAKVTGTTYNNPIPPSMFIGTYYETEPIYLNPSKKTTAAVKVLTIEDNYKILYDYGTNDGNLQPVPTYSYNFNMYYFSFTQGTKKTSFIMGTAAEGCLACNNMVADSATPGHYTSRSLQTIPFPVKNPETAPNANSPLLAMFSGYYQLSSIASGAFLSVQAQYLNVQAGVVYVVKIGISMDGINSVGYYFDATMTFANNTLTMPGVLAITFNRSYNEQNRGLVNITGTINGKTVNAFTLLNPVPLTVFGGMLLTNANGDTLTVVSNTQVIYNGIPMTNILYIPLMYILANPYDKTTTLMSFGTDGLKGNTCIVTNSSGITVVNAIPNAQ